MFLGRIEKQYGNARRVWVMDRGVPTEAVLAERRASDPPVQYLVGTPKGRLNRLEKQSDREALRRRGGSLQEPEGGPGDPPDLPSRRKPNRSPYAFLAYALQVTLTRRLHALAGTDRAPRAGKVCQMIDVHLPTADGREIVLTRYTQPEPELQLLINQLKLSLPSQPPPKITATALAQITPRSEDLLV
jgi:hypothetical protein